MVHFWETDNKKKERKRIERKNRKQKKLGSDDTPTQTADKHTDTKKSDVKWTQNPLGFGIRVSDPWNVFDPDDTL